MTPIQKRVHARGLCGQPIAAVVGEQQPSIAASGEQQPLSRLARSLQGRSPFNHAPFFCTLCGFHRKAHDEPDAPVQMIYSTKGVLQMIMERAFVEPAHEIILTEAAKKGRMPELRAKLHLTNVDINSEDSYGRTNVYWATVKGKTEALKLLLQYGGDPNRANKHDYTPVHDAANRGIIEPLQLLLQYGGDPNRADTDGNTPVHHAADRGNTEALQLMLQHGGDPNRAAKNGDTPVHMAWTTEDLALLNAAGGKQ